jgi:hypothetical protein
MTGRLVLGALVLAAGYAVWAYFHPFRPCPRCGGTGANRGSTRRRKGKCGRCKGSREVKTVGARLIHRAIRSGRSGWRNRKET